ncbi:67_t:CDS:2 [Funneliformis geosporum]|nr:67_t:CDS:2 [Funneliformis geosporum]
MASRLYRNFSKQYLIPEINRCRILSNNLFIKILEKLWMIVPEAILVIDVVERLIDRIANKINIASKIHITILPDYGLSKVKISKLAMKNIYAEARLAVEILAVVRENNQRYKRITYVLAAD